MTHNENETCQRCEKISEDLRTLVMACFYAMRELGLPFEEVAIDGAWKLFSHHETTPFGQRARFHAVQGEPREHQFYTLRVCKPCRSSWMSGIRQWFNAPNCNDRPITGTGVYRRELGATFEASAADVAAMRQGNPMVPLETVTVSVEALRELQAQIERNSEILKEATKHDQ